MFVLEHRQPAEFLVRGRRSLGQNQFAGGTLNHERVADPDQAPLASEPGLTPHGGAGLDIQADQGALVVLESVQAVDVAAPVNAAGPVILDAVAPELLRDPFAVRLADPACRRTDSVTGGAVDDVAVRAADNG